jgi:hypothetical protein
MMKYTKFAAARIIVITIFAAGGVTAAGTMAMADTAPATTPLTSAETLTPAPIPLPVPDDNTPWG